VCQLRLAASTLGLSSCEAWDRKHQPGICAACGRTAALRRGRCRACWKYASYLAGPLNTRPLFTEDTRFTVHQLSFTAMRGGAPPGRRNPRPVRPARERAEQVELPGQLALFPVRPGMHPPRRRAAERPRPPAHCGAPGQPMKLHVFWTVEAVEQHARTAGWPAPLRGRVRDALVGLFTAKSAGEPITLAELRRRRIPVRVVAGVLRQHGLLHPEADDPLPAMIARRSAGLPEAMRRDVAAWMTLLRDGGPRAHPRSWKTVSEYSRWAAPLLRVWAQRYEHLRQVTRGDVQRALAASPAGSTQDGRLVAARSLFRFLRRDGRIFTDPTTRLGLGTPHRKAVLPLTDTDYTRVCAHATTPLLRVVLLLAAVHGARPHAIRTLQLDRVNLTGRHLTLTGITRTLDDLNVALLTAWMHHRRRRWPLTANPYLIVTDASALTGRPVSDTWLQSLFQPTGITLDRLRIDRHLEEALTYGPDPLHLARVFGISPATAMRYTAAAKQLLKPADPPTVTADPR